MPIPKKNDKLNKTPHCHLCAYHRVHTEGEGTEEFKVKKIPQTQMDVTLE